MAKIFCRHLRKYKGEIILKRNSCLLLLLIALPLLAQNGKSGGAFSNSISAIIPMQGTLQTSEPLNADLQDNKKPNKFWHSPVLRISLGVISLGACVAGVVYDGKIKEKADENTRLMNEYKALPDNLQYDEYSSKMKGNVNSANKYGYLEMAATFLLVSARLDLQ